MAAGGRAAPVTSGDSGWASSHPRSSGRRSGKRSPDLVLIGAGHAAVGLKALNGIPKQGVNKRAEDIGIERQRFVGILRRLPAKTVAPDEAERVAQQHLQRRRRQRPFEQFRQPRMRRRNQAVMLRDRVALPIPPARQSRDSDRQLREFRRTGQKPIGLAGGVARRAGAVDIGLRQPVISGERPSMRPSASRRLNEIATLRADVTMVRKSRLSPSATGSGSSFSIAAVIRNEPVLRNPPRPAAGIQPEQPDVRTRRRRQRNRRRPDRVGRGLDVVVDAQAR